MRLALDHHYSYVIAERLRERGHDVVATYEQGWQQASDEDLLGHCSNEGRALLTNNVRDFVAIAQRWAEEGRQHAGLIFTSDASLPRTRAMIGTYVERLERLLVENPGEQDVVDQLLWL